MLDYDSAIESVVALQARDTDDINPLCRTQLLVYGNQVERVVVFLHGFTNCPQQFSALAESCYKSGWNVLNARLPHHGLKNRLTTELAKMRADELVAFTDDLLEVAHGLGERVCLVGLSLGGTLALRAAQQHADLDRAIVIAPMVAPRNVPLFLLPGMVAAARLLPNQFVWWDSKTRENIPGPQHAYPRFASRALAEMLLIAAQVRADAYRPDARPRARAVRLITNAADPAVDSKAARALVKRWQANGARNVEMYEFPSTLGLIHDLVDKDQPGARIKQVYPVVLEQIDGT